MIKSIFNKKYFLLLLISLMILISTVSAYEDNSTADTGCEIKSDTALDECDVDTYSTDNKNIKSASKQTYYVNNKNFKEVPLQCNDLQSFCHCRKHERVCWHAWYKGTSDACVIFRLPTISTSLFLPVKKTWHCRWIGFYSLCFRTLYWVLE